MPTGPCAKKHRKRTQKWLRGKWWRSLPLAARTQSIGQRIRQGRQAAGLTQEALAGKCDVSRAAVAQWEG
ncbi:MAG: helix-turn-helix domain-containing protein, partial [Alphaproteobacteria bacterium]|nr:helix-turn-helix domain-containing protein [Alphaproteobacteria bacterium]